MPACIAVVFFVPSEAYKADPSGVSKAGLDVVAKIDGVQYTGYGTVTENPNVAATFHIFESMEKALAILGNEQKLKPICDVWEPARIGGIDPYCFVPISDPAVALSGPFTAFSVFDLKDTSPENRQKFEELSSWYNKFSQGRFTYGWANEEKTRGVSVAAWESIEAHEAARNSPELSDKAKTFFGMIDILPDRGLYHIKLTKA